MNDLASPMCEVLRGVLTRARKLEGGARWMGLAEQHEVSQSRASSRGGGYLMESLMRESVMPLLLAQAQRLELAAREQLWCSLCGWGDHIYRTGDYGHPVDREITIACPRNVRG